tara:strand:- start:28 stop:372 length:345 start_codon:yes stop_codon:yes gene_type:complete
MKQKGTCKTSDKQDNISLETEKQYQRGEHPNSLANLTPFEKGISGNPTGRPHKYEKLAKKLKVVGETTPDMFGDVLMTADKYSDLVIQRIWYEASQGSISHIKILAELGCLDEG